MVYNQFFVRIETIVQDKTVSTTKSAFEVLEFFDGFVLVFRNTVITDVIGVPAPTYRSTVMLRRCFRGEFLTTPSAYFGFEIAAGVFEFLFRNGGHLLFA